MRVLPLLFAATLAIGASSAFADDLLGKGGKGGGGGNGGGSAPPPPVKSGGGGGGGSAPPPPVRSGGGNGGGNSGGNSGQGGLGRGGGGGNNQGNGSGNSRGNSGGSTNDRDRNGGNVVIGGGNNQNSRPPELIGRGDRDVSRSGRVTYGGSSNVNAGQTRGGSFNIPEAPRVGSNNAIMREANREHNGIQRVTGNYRNGYYQYNNNWRDDNFWYPHYQFGYTNNCYPSPFYYYPNLPGYVSTVRIDLGFIKFSWSEGSTYNYRYNNSRYDDDWDWGWSNSRNNTNRDLDNAVDDIYDSFRRGTMRNISYLIPSRGYINIELDNYIQYRIGSDDFYDLMTDLIESTYTTDYRIKRVRTYRGGASIEAEHRYRDPWGREQRTTHWYGLEEARRGYEIVAFRTGR